MPNPGGIFSFAGFGRRKAEEARRRREAEEERAAALGASEVEIRRAAGEAAAMAEGQERLAALGARLAREGEGGAAPGPQPEAPPPDLEPDREPRYESMEHYHALGAPNGTGGTLHIDANGHLRGQAADPAGFYADGISQESEAARLAREDRARLAREDRARLAREDRARLAAEDLARRAAAAGGGGA